MNNQILVQCDATRPTRMAFFGFYGRHNFGDDLFGYLLQRICDDVPHVKAMVVGASPQRELANGWHFPLVSKWIKRTGVSGSVARALTYCAALAHADVAVFGGGSLFGAHASIAFARLITSWGGIFGKSVHALGVSVGPFTNDKRRRAFLDMVSKLTTLAVRDKASVNTMSGVASMPVPANLGDLAFALPSVYVPQRGHGDVKTLIVSVHREEYVEQVMAILTEADQKGWVERVQFVSLDPESIAVTDTIKQRFEPQRVSVESVSYTNSIEEVIDLIASASCVVTSKLHGAITSYVYDVPALLFCYQRKCADFLDDNGLPGPREENPAAAACVESVRAQLRTEAKMVLFEQSDECYRAFKDFLARAAGRTLSGQACR